MLRIAILKCDSWSPRISEKFGDIDYQYRWFLEYGLATRQSNGNNNVLEASRKKVLQLQTISFDVLKGELPSKGLDLIRTKLFVAGKDVPNQNANNYNYTNNNNEERSEDREQWPNNSLDFFDGYVVTGSKHSAYSQEPQDREWMDPLEEEIRLLERSKKKLFGVCFGHQIVSKALGGKVEKIGWNLSHNSIQIEDPFRERIQYPGENLSFLCVHQDQVTQLPPDCDVWCKNQKVKVHGVVKGDHLITIQAHPEFRAEVVRELLEVKRGLIPDPIVEEALATVDIPTDSKWFAEKMVDWFLTPAKQ